MSADKSEDDIVIYRTLQGLFTGIVTCAEHNIFIYTIFSPNCAFVFLSVKPIISSAGNNALVVAENVTVNLTWMVASNPKAVIHITFMGQQIDPTVSRKTSRYVYRYTYTITSVNCNHAGVYSLRAANNIGSDFDRLNLTVIRKY